MSKLNKVIAIKLAGQPECLAGLSDLWSNLLFSNNTACSHLSIHISMHRNIKKKNMETYRKKIQQYIFFVSMNLDSTFCGKAHYNSHFAVIFVKCYDFCMNTETLLTLDSPTLDFHVSQKKYWSKTIPIYLNVNNKVTKNLFHLPQTLLPGPHFSD